MPTPDQPQNLTDQQLAILSDYEFRVQRYPSTRPSIEVRRRGAYNWFEIALIPPESNFFTIMADVMVACVKGNTPIIEEEPR